MHLVYEYFLSDTLKDTTLHPLHANFPAFAFPYYLKGIKNEDVIFLQFCAFLWLICCCNVICPCIKYNEPLSVLFSTFLNLITWCNRKELGVNQKRSCFGPEAWNSLRSLPTVGNRPLVVIIWTATMFSKWTPSSWPLLLDQANNLWMFCLNWYKMTP